MTIDEIERIIAQRGWIGAYSMWLTYPEVCQRVFGDATPESLHYWCDVAEAVQRVHTWCNPFKGEDDHLSYYGYFVRAAQLSNRGKSSVDDYYHEWKAIMREKYRRGATTAENAAGLLHSIWEIKDELDRPHAGPPPDPPFKPREKNDIRVGEWLVGNARAAIQPTLEKIEAEWPRDEGLA